MLEAVYFLNGLVMVALPLALGVWIARRWSVEWGIFGLGALAFAASQVLHIPFNQFLLLPWLGADREPGIVLQIGGALALGLSAGIFEELARYIIIRRMKDHRRGFGPALMLGAGHGGLEAIILGGAALYALIQALTLRDADLAQVVAPERLELTRAQLAAFWNAPVYAAMLGALERCSALMLHLLDSVLVMLAVARRQLRYLVLAILAHTLFNAIALVTVERYGVYVTEALLLAMGLAGVLAMRRLRRLFPEHPEPPKVRLAVKKARLPAEPFESDSQKLDDSRFV
jgi:uncharacterized membrane protein YhfC